MSTATVDDDGEDGGVVRIGGAEVPPGARVDLRLSVSESYTGDRLTVPVTVVNGDRPGPRLFVTAAVHGDELNGIAIARELQASLEPTDVVGTLLIVPVVNVLGLPLHSRYLPDRRDLNRCFPGSENGSMASRLANALLNELVLGCDVGVDLHTAASGRANLPQVRCAWYTDHDDGTMGRRSLEYARAFGAPIIIDAPLRAGSLREAAGARGIPVLTYEAGEALRFEDDAIGIGIAGVRRLMGHLGMLDAETANGDDVPDSLEADETHWIRADRGGIMTLEVGLGDRVSEGQTLWTVSSPFGRDRNVQVSPYEGVVIGATTIPLVNPGDAVVHIAVPGGDAGFDETVDLEPFL